MPSQLLPTKITSRVSLAWAVVAVTASTQDSKKAAAPLRWRRGFIRSMVSSPDFIVVTTDFGEHLYLFQAIRHMTQLTPGPSFRPTAGIKKDRSQPVLLISVGYAVGIRTPGLPHLHTSP